MIYILSTLTDDLYTVMAVCQRQT